MGVADTVHRSVSCPPKKKWINAYKQDEDGRDDVTFVSAPPVVRHQPGAVAVPPVPMSPARSSRTPSAFIATHHSYVRSPAVVPPPPPPPPQPQPPLSHSPAAAAASLAQRAASGGAPEQRNGALPLPPAPPPQPVYRYDSADDMHERKTRVSAGTREVHNKLEKNRRAHLKECFENLRRQVPVLDEKRTSNLGILRGALRYIGTLKRKERECEHEMERLAREKIANQQRLAQLKRDLSAKWDHIDFSQLLPDPSVHCGDNDSNSTLSATESRMDDGSYQASPERELEPPSPEPRRRPVDRPAASSPAYLGHSSGYSSSSPTVAAAAPAVSAGQPAGLARLAAMASSQQKLLATTADGHKVSVVHTTTAADIDGALLHAEHGLQYVPVTALSEVGRPVTTVSYVEQHLDASRKALVLETVPGHIVNAQLMHSAAGTVRLSSAGVQGVQLTAAPSPLQVLTPAGVRLLAAPAPAHNSVSAAVSGLTQLVSSALPRLVTQPVTHLVATSPAPGTMTVLGQSKVVKQLPVISPFITSASQPPTRSMVVVSAAGLIPVTKH